MIGYILGGAVIVTVILVREYGKYANDIGQWMGKQEEDCHEKAQGGK